MVSGTVLTCVAWAIQTSLTTMISIPKLLSGCGHFTQAGQLIFVLFYLRDQNGGGVGGGVVLGRTFRPEFESTATLARICLQSKR